MSTAGMPGALACRPFKVRKPRLIAMPHKVLVIDTLIGTTSTDEVQVLRHVAKLAAMVNDFDELQYAVRRAEHIQRADQLLATAEKSFFGQAPITTTTNETTTS